MDFPIGLIPAPLAHVSTSPPSIPDSRISRVRFWPWPSEFFRNRPSRNATMLKCSLTSTPSSFGLPIPSLRLSGTSYPGICVRVRPGIIATAKCPGPLCQKMGVIHLPDGLLDHLRGHYPIGANLSTHDATTLATTGHGSPFLLTTRKRPQALFTLRAKTCRKPQERSIAPMVTIRLLC